jgi:drug/metabolite transporter (DMT)-like permease
MMVSPPGSFLGRAGFIRATLIISKTTIMQNLTSHQRGLLMTIVGVLVLTPDALLVRLVETDHWTLMFWRGVIASIVLLAVSSSIEKKSPFRILADLRHNGLFCALLFGASNASFVLSITHTAVANTLVILASMPFIAAILTVVLMRKNPPLRTWVAIVLAIAGIVVVFWGRIGGGNIFGDVLGLFCALFMAATLVSLSFNPRINALTAIGVGGVLSALFALLMGATPIDASANDFFYLALDGGIVVPVAFGLISYGPKLISAPEVSLIMLMETVLGPLWVWLVVSEVPPPATFIGGCIVIGAILINIWLGLRTDRARAAA